MNLAASSYWTERKDRLKYREGSRGDKLSQLGYGCMRFTKKGGAIDFEKAEKEVMYAIENGVNYFDTAYMYPGSEECLGRILEKNGVRDRVNIATKLPQYIMRSMSGIEKTFRTELERLRTDHIDYYLMHMFTDYSEWEKLKGLGMEQWIADRKADGSIRNIGFSYHGNLDSFLRILDAYDWDFCMIQYNYLDEYAQAGRTGLEAAEKKGLPVMIMEPLRGGKLVLLPEKAKELLKREKGYTPAELSFRWLWDQPGVTCVLSGMNSMDMVEENVRIASEADTGMLGEDDFALVEKIKTIIREREKVRCTGCAYCMPCPKNVDIPGYFHYYNLMYIENNKSSARFEFARAVGMQKEPAFASQCIGCGRCEKQCPQRINIREMLKKADRDLRPLPYKAGLVVVRKFMHR